MSKVNSVSSMLQRQRVLRRSLSPSGSQQPQLKFYSFHFYTVYWSENICNRKREDGQQQREQQCTEMNIEKLDTFHRAISSCLFIFHFFGLMPLKNILDPDPHKLKFQFNSGSMLFSVGLFICCVLRFGKTTQKILAAGVNSKNIIGLVFFVIILTTFVLFLKLASRWPQLMRYWLNVEMIFLMPPYVKLKWSLRLKLQLVTCTFCLIALVEHILYNTSQYYNFRMRALNCEANSSFSFSDYVKTEFTDLFTVLPFNRYSTIAILLSNFIFTYVWSYPDLFIMLIGLSLATRFKQFAEYLRGLQGQYVPDSMWYDLRQDHIKLCELLEAVDDHLSYIILVAGLNDMYYICNQLLYIVTKLRWPINYLYFWFSLMFLISRTALSFLGAATVNDASLEPLEVLHLVPAGCWSEEVQRFSLQLTGQCISLTGKRFYNITRKNLFAFFATIATYELVLLQLDHNSKSLPDLCD